MSNKRCGGSVAPFMGSMCAGMIALVVAGAAQADILSVPSEYETIQAAIDAAQNGDEVVVSPGTYAEAINYNGKAITVRGVNNPTITSAVPVVAFVSGETLDARLDGFVIQGNGTGPFGGGIKIIESFATITNCTISGSASVRGGGVSVQYGGASILNCQLTGSAFNGAGGALSVYESAVTMSNCFVGGTAAVGGGIAVERGSSLTANAVTIGVDAAGEILPNPFLPVPTTAAVAGGGLFATNSTLNLDTVTMTQCVVGNLDTADDSRGGGLFAVDCTLAPLNNCTFTGNTVQGINRAAGAGVYVVGDLSVRNGFFVGNSLASGGDFNQDGIVETDGTVQGGAIYTEGGTAEIVGCTFYNNLVNTGIEAEDELGNGCLVPNGVAEGGAIKVDGDLLVDKCTFHDPPPPFGAWLAGGNINSSLEARGGAINAGTGDVTIANTTMNNTTAIGAVELPAPPDDEECGTFVWEGEASGGGIWTLGRVTVDASNLGNFPLSPTPGSVASAYPDASGGWIFAGGGVELRNSTGDEAQNTQVANGTASSNDEDARLSDPPAHPLGGGGIHAGTSVVLISDTSLTGCISETNDGGGILCGGATVTDSIIASNTTPEGLGGCIMAVGSGKSAGTGVSMTNVVLTGCSADGEDPFVIGGEEIPAGGGAITTDGPVVLTNVEAASNSCATNGGVAHTVDDIKIIGGSYTNNGAAEAGGVGFALGTITVTDVDSFSANQVEAAEGGVAGGVFFAVSGFSATNSVFYKNIAVGTADAAPAGGAIACLGATSLENCEFILCQTLGEAQSAQGGAIAAAGDLEVLDCYFKRCNAETRDPQVPAIGGAIVVSEAISVELSDSEFENCFSTGSGGAVFALDTGALDIFGTTFRSNDALGGGGAVGGLGIGQMGVAVSVFTDNSAGVQGGAIDAEFAGGVGLVNIVSSQFALNSSEGVGGAMHLTSAASQTVNVTSSGIGSNTAADGGGIFLGGQVDLVLSNDTFTCNTPNDVSGDFDDAGGNVFSSFADCNGNGLCDAIDIAEGSSTDCNANLVPDDCDIADGTSTDGNGNGIPDECDVIDDCNGNGIDDSIDIGVGKSEDCNENGVPDECDLDDGTLEDNNEDGIPDACQGDCDGDGTLDEDELASGEAEDCNGNGIPDNCDIADGTSTDNNGDGRPDECIADCNGNGIADAIDIASGDATDCNVNGIPDECDIVDGGAQDQNANGIPDSCECLGDLNGDGIVNGTDLSQLLGGWGTELGDINGDELVDGTDLTILLSNWGLCG